MTDTKRCEPVGDEGLNALYRRYAAWLGRRVRRHVGADAAEDVVQETYLRLAPYRDRAIRHPKSLLLRIAMNLVRDEYRRRSRRRRMEQLSIEPTERDASQFDAFAVKQALMTMPPLYRDVFVLSRFRGMTYPEIATKLDISVKTVEWRMSRALEYCAARLGA